MDSEEGASGWTEGVIPEGYTEKVQRLMGVRLSSKKMHQKLRDGDAGYDQSPLDKRQEKGRGENARQLLSVFLHTKGLAS